MGVSALSPRTTGPLSLHTDGDDAVSTPGDVGPARIRNGLSPPRNDWPMGVSVSTLPALVPRSMKGFSLLCCIDLEPEPGRSDSASSPGEDCGKGLGMPPVDRSLPDKREREKGLAPPRTDLSMGVLSPWACEALFSMPRSVGDVPASSGLIKTLGVTAVFTGEVEEDDVVRGGSPEEAEGVAEAEAVACGSPTTPLSLIHVATSACDAELLNQAWVFIIAQLGRFLESFCRIC